MDLHYSMIIRWSEEDQLYVVRFPEWGPYMGTHGQTYEEAATKGREILESLVEMTLADGKPLPPPQLLADQAVS